MGHPLRVGLFLRLQELSTDELRSLWRMADEAGFDHLWGFDHLTAVGDDPGLPSYEGWAMLAAMAETTQRIRIGCLVTGNLYRHPAVLAKLAVTVDHLSGGRLIVGIGASWNEPEFRMVGMPFPAPAERVRRLDEACSVLKLLWTEDRATFDGRYYRLEHAIGEPKPVQRPYPPIWIGGHGPKRTMRVVARHADVWSSNARSEEGHAAAARALEEHCRAIGRDPETIPRSVMLHWRDPDDALARIERHRQLGFTEVVLRTDAPGTRRKAEIAAREILPRCRELG
ncbi:MAG TPA: TIGR03560 family F420-dependent LLM class oxidoreductase [Candidatus Limnocylindria bacterium]